MDTFFPLTVKAVKQETPDSVSLTFEKNEHFAFNAGQYITLRLKIEGKTFRRAYSLSTSPLDNQLNITIKRVAGGKVSNYLCSEVKQGQILELMPPMGNFTSHQAIEKGKSYFMFAGGSGITPIFSMLKTILQTETNSHVYLLFANKNEGATIFKKELDSLTKQYEGKFFLKYIFEEVAKTGLLQSVFTQNDGEKNILEGIADKRNTQFFLNEFRPKHRAVEYFICGPTAMMNGIESLLIERDVSTDKIRLERFNTEEQKELVAMENAPIVATLKAYLRGETIETQMREGQTVLEALLQAGQDPPYSCRTGSCATCIGKCKSGKVKMKTNSILEEKEIAEGLILTCQAIPLTENVEVEY